MNRSRASWWPGGFLCALALATASLAGCGTLAPSGADDAYWLKPGLAPPSGVVGSLLYYFDYVRGLTPAARQDERDRLARGGSDDVDDFRRVQRAIALSAPPSTPADRRRALELLGQVAGRTDARDAEVRLLATVLLHDVELERRLQSMRELERARAETAKELERKMEQIREMQRKLDAMKDIERQLLQRDRIQQQPARETRP